MHQITGIQSVKPGQHFDPEPDDAFFRNLEVLIEIFMIEARLTDFLLL